MVGAAHSSESIMMSVLDTTAKGCLPTLGHRLLSEASNKGFSFSVYLFWLTVGLVWRFGAHSFVNEHPHPCIVCSEDHPLLTSLHCENVMFCG